MGVRERRQRQRSDIRGKIMDAARRLFVTHGYEAVSMRKIATEIEYSPTAIYVHFKDKEALMRELCAHDFGALAAVFKELAEISDPLRRITAIGQAYMRFALQYPNHYRLMFMTTHAHPELSESERAIQGNPDEDAYAFLRASVFQALAAGHYRGKPADAELVTQTLWAGVHGVASLQIAKGHDPWITWRPLQGRANLMLETLMHGLFFAHAPAGPLTPAPRRKRGGP